MWKITKKKYRIWNDNLIRLDIWWDIIFDYIPEQEILDKQMLEEMKEKRNFTIVDDGDTDSEDDDDSDTPPPNPYLPMPGSSKSKGKFYYLFFI